MESQTTIQDRSTGEGQGDINSSVVFPPAGLGKLLLLGLMALGLCMFMPLTIFAPVPLALSFLIFGRIRSWSLTLGLSIPLLALALFAKDSEWSKFGMVLGGGLVYAHLSAVAVSEIIFRRLHPSQGLMSASLIMVLSGAVLVGGLSVSGKINPANEIKSFMTAQLNEYKKLQQEAQIPGEEAREVIAYLEKPELILRWLPAAMALSMVLGLWVVLFVVLRNSQVWRRALEYPYKLSDLMRFQVPELWVWPLILGLSLYVGSDYGLGEKAEIWGGNLLYALAPFYFFQGLGVYLDFLAYLRLAGPLRAIFVFLTVYTGWKYLVVLGVFDLWVNFRRFMMNSSEKREQ